MRIAKFTGPMILVLALALGACSTTSGTAQQEQIPPQENAEDAVEGTTVTDPPEDVVVEDTESAPSQEALGTRDTPLKPDTEVDFETGWTVAVGVTNLDSWSQIAEIDSYMDEPEADRVFVSAPLAVSFDGAGSADPGFDLTYAFIGSKGNTFTDRDNCAPFDVALWSLGDMYAGAQDEALMCVSVPKDQAEGGVWRIQYVNDEFFELVEAYYSTS